MRVVLVTIMFAGAIFAGGPLNATAREHLLTDRLSTVSPPVNATAQPGAALPENLTISPSLSNTLPSQPPMLTGRYTLNGQTFMPYIGAGFSGGETKDPNRAILRESAGQEDRLLRGPLGGTLVPNEFQLGVRIPF